METSILEKEIIRDEALRLYPYKCSANKDTIFYGKAYKLNQFKADEIQYMLENGITKRTALYCLRNDIKQATMELESTFSWFNELDDVRQDALINMNFNLGFTRFNKFKKMIKALSEHNYDMAGFEADNSKWSRQVGKRAARIIKMIDTGKRV